MFLKYFIFITVWSIFYVKLEFGRFVFYQNSGMFLEIFGRLEFRVAHKMRTETTTHRVVPVYSQYDLYNLFAHDMFIYIQKKKLT
jgi:hypothetical protein